MAHYWVSVHTKDAIYADSVSAENEESAVDVFFKEHGEINPDGVVSYKVVLDV